MSETTKRWKITIEYKGTNYAGWQIQKEVLTIQEVIQKALKAFCQQDITINAAGRTDAGVHAYGQVAHFDLDYGDRPLTGFELTKAINAHIRNEDVSIINAEIVPANFNARGDAKNKLYTYRIINRPAPPVIENGLAWYVKKPLNAPAMHDAAQILIGDKYDFTTFRDSECQANSPMRTLDRLNIETKPYDNHGGQEILIHAEARSFLHHQVRNMVGTLTLVGEGKWTKDDFQKAFEARDRTKGGITAPADGLYLMRIDY